MNRAADRSADLARALLGVCRGDLSVTDDPNETPYEHAMMHIAAAQLRAISIAIATRDADPPDDKRGAPGWCTDREFSDHDAVAALGGVAALLDAGAHSLWIAREVLEATALEGEAPRG